MYLEFWIDIIFLIIEKFNLFKICIYIYKIDLFRIFLF